mgnify:CR=1 FL=1
MAAPSVSELALLTGAAARAALASSAACRAGETVAMAATGGQVPLTGTSARRLSVPPALSTHAKRVGEVLRWGA